MPVYKSNEAIRAYLLARVDLGPGGCWLWRLRLDRGGYGQAHVNGRECRAARVAYQVFVGPIPDGFDVHHTCPNRHCICPEHLRPMPHGTHLRLHAASGSWAGSRNSRAKLTEADAQFIKVAGKLVSAQSLADHHGVSLRTVYNARREGWKHVGLPDFPQRSQEEALADCQAATRHALDVLLSLQQDLRERGEPEPPSLEPSITLARLCTGAWEGAETQA